MLTTDYGFKKIGDVDLLESVSNSANVIIEDSGVLKKMSAKNIGAIKTVNGAAPDENGNVEIQAGVQSNWDQMDDTALDYIKNRTHYDAGDVVEIELLPATDLAFELSPPWGYASVIESDFALELGQQYVVIIDGKRYIETAVENALMGGISLGENIFKLYFSLITGMPATYTKPFIIVQSKERQAIEQPSMQIMMLESTETTHNIVIAKIEQYSYKELYNVTHEKFDYINSQYGKYLWDLSNDLIIGLDYKIIWDGIEYICRAVSLEEGIITIGNATIMGGENTGEPFVFMSMDGILSYFMDLENIYTPEENKTISITIDKQLEDGSYENVVTVIDFALTYESDMSIYASEANLEGVLELNSIYRVTYDNIEYICSASDIDGIIALGNPSVIPEIASFGDTGEPFLMGYNEGSGIFVYEAVEAPEVYHDIKFSGYISNVKQLNKKYIPNNIDLPVASSETLGGVKVWDTTSSDLSNSSDYSKIYLSTNDNTIYASKPIMSTLTFTGNTSTTYNGNSAVNVYIPTTLKNPYALTFTGGVTGSYDGSSAKTVNVPTSLKNPYKLTFTGTTTGSYDGSAAVTIDIPTGLPNVSSIDNGKVLGVSNGVWSTVEMQPIKTSMSDLIAGESELESGVIYFVYE